MIFLGGLNCINQKFSTSIIYKPTFFCETNLSLHQNRKNSTFLIAKNWGNNNISTEPPLISQFYMQRNYQFTPQECKTFWCNLQVWCIRRLYKKWYQIPPHLPILTFKIQPLRDYLGQGPPPIVLMKKNWIPQPLQ